MSEQPYPILRSHVDRKSDEYRRYHQAGVPHYWILDQLDRTLTVHRHAADGYTIALRAEAGHQGFTGEALAEWHAMQVSSRSTVPSAASVTRGLLHNG